MRVKPLSRRALLRGAAGAALGLPFLDAMTRPSAQAQAAGVPKRIIFYYTGNGFPPLHWRCDVNAEVTAAADFELSHILSPLAQYKDKCTFIEGLPLNSGLDSRQNAVAHAGGTSALFTGSYAPPGEMYGGKGPAAQGSGFPPTESVDQTIAQAVGSQTRFPAYYMGVQVAGPVLLKTVFYAGKDQPITPNADPNSTLSELFTDTGENAGEGLLRVNAAEQAAVLDAVLGSAQSLRPKLGAEDRARLDLHLTQVREIESSLGAMTGANPLCARPEVPAGLVPNLVEEFPRVGRVQADLMAMALTCDLTRVGGFFFTPALHNPTYTWLGHTDGHHNMTHDQAQYDTCADVSRWHAGELNYLVDRLANTPEGDGSLLDNTVIVWTTECAQTYKGDPHNLTDIGFTLIGGGQGHFKTGQYLKLPGGDNYSHNRLLLSLAHYMGLDTDVIGESEYCTEGELPHLTA